MNATHVELKEEIISPLSLCMFNSSDERYRVFLGRIAYLFFFAASRFRFAVGK